MLDEAATIGFKADQVLGRLKMATACLLQWFPDSLYNTATSTVVVYYSVFRSEIKTLPESVQFDIYYKLYNKGRLCELAMELSSLDTFSRVLRVVDKRNLLHHCFQAVMDHGTRLSSILADAFIRRCALVNANDWKANDKLIQLGFALGGFLVDAGWLADSENVHLSCLEICKSADNVNGWQHSLHCCTRLMHIRNCNCIYNEAESMWKEAMSYVEKLTAHGIHVNQASLCSEYSTLMFARSSYDESYKLCCTALNELSSSLYPRIIVDVFRQAAKVCVVRREFKRAEILIKFAVQYAREHFGGKHQVFSDALLDYGFFLLNVDLICQSVKVYQTALDIRIAVFGGNNLHVAIAHEDLAYCSYVHEYSSGKFQDAKHHADVAIDIITRILPQDHLLLASSKRVKALILEEIAIDSHNKTVEAKLLSEARELHLSSLMLAKQAFGENNVQTAKHYGNLGRLFQSMHKYKEAEEMHLKAIAIKEQLLGADDYEVALSVGHLASLYNYDMQKYDEAERLYLRSISIGQRLFGNGYSGLEYDYRGLLRLYQSRGDLEKAAEYASILHDWNHLRDRKHNEAEVLLEFEVPETCEAAVEEFFALPGRSPL